MSMFVFKSNLQESLTPPDGTTKCKWSKDSKNQEPSAHTKWDWKPKSQKILPDILAAIGNTPMVKLNKIPQSEGVECEIYGKCEFLNPAGSIKDRVALRCITEAENNGSLKPGGTVIEVSSGNTGVSLAWTCAIKGYGCIIVMPDKFSKEKENIIRSLGGDVVRVSMSEKKYSPNGMFGMAHVLHKKTPNSIIIDQFSNPANPLMHYDTTAEEIFDQCDGKVDMMVMGCGTGGTLGGISRKFQEISPQTIFIGADPYGSTYAIPDSLNKSDVKMFEIEGIGYNELTPPVCDRFKVQKWYKFHDKESLNMSRRLIKEEGLLVGTTSGLLLACALKAIKEFKIGKGKRVVILLPDGTKNYLSKFVQDPWMEQRGYMPCVNTGNLWWWDMKVADLDNTPTITIKTTQTIEDVLAVMKKNSVNYLPVLGENGQIVGVAIRKTIENKLIYSPGSGIEKIVTLMDRVYSKLPKSTSTLGLVSRVLEIENYVMVVESKGDVEIPFSLFTSEDVLRIIQSKKSS